MQKAVRTFIIYYLNRRNSQAYVLSTLLMGMHGTSTDCGQVEFFGTSPPLLFYFLQALRLQNDFCKRFVCKKSLLLTQPPPPSRWATAEGLSLQVVLLEVAKKVALAAHRYAI
jgi:hypothetical protein